MIGGRVSQPVGQVRLTNVAIVRLKKNGKRFEVAAYKNKVMNWRTGVEKDLSEVLQIDTVFNNVSKGIAASKKDMEEAFGTFEQDKAAIYILNHGEIEVGEKERQALFESLFRDVATIVAEKCVNPDTQRPYTLSLIDKALHDAHFAVVLGKSAKQQALKAVTALQKSGFSIQRARMKVRITVPVSDAAAMKEQLASMHAELEAAAADAGPSAGGSDGWTVVAGGAFAVFHAVIDPGCYRAVEEAVARFGGAGAGAALEVLSLAASAVEPISRAAARGGAGGPGGGGGEDGADDSDAGSDGDEDASRKGGKAAGGGAGRGRAADSDPEDDSAAGRGRAGGAGSSGAASAAADLTAAAARGTGMLVSRVTVPGSRLSCASCGGLAFDSPDMHRAHFRSDLHRFNLKRKTRGEPPISDDAFHALSDKERAAVLEAIE